MEFTNRTLRRGNGNHLVSDVFGVQWVNPDRIAAFVDIGANIGQASVRGRCAFPDARIVAVEPCPDTRKVLSRNLDGMNVEIHDTAIGNGQTLQLSRTRKGYLRIVRAEGSHPMETRTFHEFWNSLHLDPTRTFVKIDIEGCEAWMLEDPDDFSVLQALAALHLEYHPNFIRRIPNARVNTLRRFVKWGGQHFAHSHFIHFHHSTLLTIHPDCIRR